MNKRIVMKVEFELYFDKDGDETIEVRCDALGVMKHTVRTESMVEARFAAINWLAS